MSIKRTGVLLAVLLGAALFVAVQLDLPSRFTAPRAIELLSPLPEGVESVSYTNARRIQSIAASIDEANDRVVQKVLDDLENDLPAFERARGGE